MTAEQAEEQRRGVDRAVVLRERRLSERCGLAHPQLVEDLARFLVALVVALLPKSAGQQPQRLLGDPAHEGLRLERGDEAVAAEQGGEPGHAGGVVGVAVELRVEQVEVVERTLEDPVEELVVRRDLGDGVVVFARGAAPDLTVPALGDLEVHRQVDRAPGLEVEVEHERAVVEEARGGRGSHARGAPYPIAPDQREAVRARVGRRPLVLRHDSAQLEHRLEVRAEAQLERQLDRLPVVAADCNPLAQRACGVDRALHPQPQRLGGHATPVAEIEVRIRELVHRLGARGVGGREQSRQPAADAQLVRAEEAAVPEPEAERVIDSRRQAAVTQ